MSQTTEIARVLYRALFQTSRRLSNQVNRHRTADLFSQGEVEWLQANSPAVLSATGHGEEALREVIRKSFKNPLTEDMDAELDRGFSLLSMMNNRLALLERAAVDSVSDSLTHGVRVQVKSKLNHPEATNLMGYFYEYTVKIKNESVEQPVQLVGRHWIITDFDGHEHEVIGPGVIGQQPTLDLGDEFEYKSFTPLRSRRGTMSGTYHMIATATGEMFDVSIGPFALSPYA